MSPIEIVAADREFVCTVSYYPEAACDPWVEKIEGGARKRVALETDLCGDDAFSVRRVVDSAVGYRRELYAVLAVKYNSVNGVRVLTASDSVEYHVSDRHLTEKGLISRFGVDDP